MVDKHIVVRWYLNIYANINLTFSVFCLLSFNVFIALGGTQAPNQTRSIIKYMKNQTLPQGIDKLIVINKIIFI